MRGLLNPRLSAFGEITDLSLDSSRRRARVRFALRGESDPIDINIRKYDIDHGDKGDWLIVVDAVASREWMTAALHQFVVGRRFHVSPKAGMALRLLA